jgi:AcrR family transcriptional regulator
MPRTKRTAPEGEQTKRRARKPVGSRPRDVEATKRRLVDAVGAILARDGFSRLGVNAIAAEAQTDKALIYRYFGGLPELFEAYAESTSFWPTVEEMAGGPVESLAPVPRAERWARAIALYIAELRKRPLSQEILAWELSERNEVTARLESVRERRSMALLKALAHDVPPSTDVAAIAALFGAAVHYLLLRARKIRIFNGIDLRTDEGWARIERAAQAMVLGAVQTMDP